MNKTSSRKLTLSGLFLAIAMVLPFLTGQIPEIGSALSPMHIPVLLCGFVCGWPFGLAVGIVSPFLRFALFGMPPIFPMGLSMALEMATYGAVAGLVYARLGKRTVSIFVALIAAMLLGRFAWGGAMWLFTSIQGGVFTFNMFLAGAFITALPGIVCHLILIPIVMILLKKAHLIEITQS